MASGNAPDDPDRGTHISHMDRGSWGHRVGEITRADRIYRRLSWANLFIAITLISVLALALIPGSFFLRIHSVSTDGQSVVLSREVPFDIIAEWTQEVERFGPEGLPTGQIPCWDSGRSLYEKRPPVIRGFRKEDGTLVPPDKVEKLVEDNLNRRPHDRVNLATRDYNLIRFPLTHQGGPCKLHPGEVYEFRAMWEPIFTIGGVEIRMSKIVHAERFEAQP